MEPTVIVILSRHDGVIDRLKARLAGTQAYLTKPFTTQMIVDVVNNSLGLSTPPSSHIITVLPYFLVSTFSTQRSELYRNKWARIL